MLQEFVVTHHASLLTRHIMQIIINNSVLRLIRNILLAGPGSHHTSSALGSSFHKMRIIQSISYQSCLQGLQIPLDSHSSISWQNQNNSHLGSRIYIFLLLEIVDPRVDHLRPTRRDIPAEINITVNQVMSLSPVIMDSTNSQGSGPQSQ